MLWNNKKLKDPLPAKLKKSGIDREVFYDEIRTMFGKLTQKQVDGMDGIFDAIEENNVTSIRHMAYIFATSYHETAKRMYAVREGLATSDASARRIVSKMGYRYARPDATSDRKDNLKKTGHVYYGRGHVQLTWADNYLKVGRIIGQPLHANPDLALDDKISAQILVVGMMKGLYTGKSLGKYFNANTNDPVGARRIVNGIDKKHLIADYHNKFLVALDKAD